MRAWRRFLLSLLIISLLLNTSCIVRKEVYFSPEGGTQERIIEAIGQSQESIDIAMYSFTSEAIALALWDAKKRGVAIRIIADTGQSESSYSQIPWLEDKGIPVKLLSGKGRGIMHDKFAIFDSALLVTGSYNWTANAEGYNWENAVFLNDRSIIRAYQDEFEKMWRGDSE